MYKSFRKMSFVKFSSLWIITGVFILFLIHYWYYNYYNGFTTDGPYYIKEIPNFLSKEECRKIQEISNGRLDKSRVYTSNSDIEDKTVRISEQCWLKDLDDPILATISQRVAKLTRTDLKSQEEFQVVKYDEGGFYKPHYDACNKETDDCVRLNKGLGPRYITVIMYLNDDFEGGETHFPNIQQSVKPEMGKAAIFYNVDNHGEILPKSLHGGLDVRNGNKWIANKWIRLTSLADKY
jgi:prolyl 4-hydroxylase